MEYTFFLEDIGDRFTVKCYANIQGYEFSNDADLHLISSWSDDEWYEGMISVRQNDSDSLTFFSFSSFMVKNAKSRLFDLRFLLCLVNPPCNEEVDQFAEKIMGCSRQNERQPFPSVQISRNFLST